ncbi:hypothetical protein [Candidatus Kuenenia stuttgartiensis]|uniref:hypothetical protein n=1 Tax=Kuenenia stuttgartiensis TaxID=174633 RepID=UPI0013ECE5F0|nr:hypothetical protein [Candidatus Kuenenia stuttgartiensis]MCF6152313.1 hypothetical protein [Candidatus Kuenenia stuttgartiensis]
MFRLDRITTAADAQWEWPRTGAAKSKAFAAKRIGDRHSKPDGLVFFNHVTLAVTPERLCLGVLDAELWVRDFEDRDKNDKRNQKPIGEKESYRWLEGYRRVCELSEQLPGTMLVSISDREGDIYECFWESVCMDEGKRAEFIIRGCNDRRLPEMLEDGCYKKLMEEVSGKTHFGRGGIQNSKNREPFRPKCGTVSVKACRV